ncbi:RNA polymerase sigma factor [Lysobacter sp. BMK333-48F3]|uniref:RNA polymerase sigma factor n=1 Tax=Lysobacter sp. BMK333-48F3 TaxID=2867962 RepID=UPI001C8C8998|nr:RNA polymerase sigma factor [Lysobacter sp. BMK333-48F3]MBX9400547.1 RNA polymerase sigma factor [Lysobacter sp. BMK333-48F3]
MNNSEAGDAPEAGAAPGAADLPLLAARYRPALVRYFTRHLPSADDAEDLAQEALVRLVRMPSLDGVSNVEAFLLQIASNLLRDHFRRDKSHQVQHHVSIDEVARDWPSEDPHGECVYEGNRRLQSFLAALDELPPRCRQVFLLQRYEGLTYSAIAKRLQISVSAVEKNMMRALLHFDARLGEA